MKFINWISGFFADQRGRASRKAIVVYIALYYLYIMVKSNAATGREPNEMLLGSIVVIILFGLGAITSEFFKKE